EALSSAVAMKVNCDLQLTLMASSLYRLLAVRVGNGYEAVRSRHLFRDLIDATADLTIEEARVVVKFQKRAHNPLLIAAGFDRTDVVIPWLGGKRLRLGFGWPHPATSAEHGVKSRTNRSMSSSSRSERVALLAGFPSVGIKASSTRHSRAVAGVYPGSSRNRLA